MYSGIARKSKVARRSKRSSVVQSRTAATRRGSRVASDEKRYLVLASSYRPSAPPEFGSDARLTSRELDRAHSRFRAAIDTLPLPTSYLDVPPSGAAQIYQDGSPQFFTLREALAVVVRQNKAAIASVGRGIKDLTSEWYVVAKLGHSTGRFVCADMTRGAGEIEETVSHAIQIVRPGVSLRRANAIDWPVDGDVKSSGTAPIV